MTNVPMIDVERSDDPPFSRQYAGVQYRGHAQRRAKYTPIRTRRQPPCDECFALQHETGGDYGSRAVARVRRVLSTGELIDLCTRHAATWKARDTKEKAL
jgi:hypothetical protein